MSDKQGKVKSKVNKPAVGGTAPKACHKCKALDHLSKDCKSGQKKPRSDDPPPKQPVPAASPPIGHPAVATPRRARSEQSNESWLQAFQAAIITKLTPDKMQLYAAVGLAEDLVLESTAEANSHGLMAALRIRTELNMWEHVKRVWSNGGWIGKKLLLVGAGQRQNTALIPSTVETFILGPRSQEFGNPTTKDAVRGSLPFAQGGEVEPYWLSFQHELRRLGRGDVVLMYNTAYYIPDSLFAEMDSAADRGVVILASLMVLPKQSVDSGARGRSYPIYPHTVQQPYKHVESVAVPDGDGWDINCIDNFPNYSHGWYPDQFVGVGTATGGMTAALWVAANTVKLCCVPDLMVYDVPGGKLWFPSSHSIRQDSREKTVESIAGVLTSYYHTGTAFPKDLMPEVLTTYGAKELAGFVADQMGLPLSYGELAAQWARTVGTKQWQTMRRGVKLWPFWAIVYGFLMSWLSSPVLPIWSVSFTRLSSVVHLAFSFLRVIWLYANNSRWAEADCFWLVSLVATFVQLLFMSWRWPLGMASPFYRGKIAKVSTYVVQGCYLLLIYAKSMSGTGLPLYAVSSTYVRFTSSLIPTLQWFGIQVPETDLCRGWASCTLDNNEYNLGFGVLEWGEVTSYEVRLAELLTGVSVVAPWQRWLQYFIELLFKMTVQMSRTQLLGRSIFLLLAPGWDLFPFSTFEIIILCFALMFLKQMDWFGSGFLRFLVPGVGTPFWSAVAWLAGIVNLLIHPVLYFEDGISYKQMAVVRENWNWEAAAAALIILYWLSLANMPFTTLGTGASSFMPLFVVEHVPGVYRAITGRSQRVAIVRKDNLSLLKRTRRGYLSVGGSVLTQAEGYMLPPCMVYGDSAIVALIKRNLVPAPQEDLLVLNEYQAFIGSLFAGVEQLVTGPLAVNYLRQMALQFSGDKRLQYQLTASYLANGDVMPVAPDMSLKTYSDMAAGSFMHAFTKRELSLFKTLSTWVHYELASTSDSLGRAWSGLVTSWKPRAVCFPQVPTWANLKEVSALFGTHLLVKEMYKLMVDHTIVCNTCVNLEELCMDVESRILQLDTFQYTLQQFTTELLEVYTALGHNPELACRSTHILGSTFISKVFMLALNRTGQVSLALTIPFDRLVARAGLLAHDYGTKAAEVHLDKLDGLLLLVQPSGFGTMFVKALISYVSRVTTRRQAGIDRTYYMMDEGAYSPIDEFEDRFTEIQYGVDPVRLRAELRDFSQYVGTVDVRPVVDEAFGRQTNLPKLVVSRARFPILHSFLIPAAQSEQTGSLSQVVRLARSLSATDKRFETLANSMLNGREAWICASPFHSHPQRGLVKCAQVNALARQLNSRVIVLRGAGRLEAFSTLLNEAASTRLLIIVDYDSCGMQKYEYRRQNWEKFDAKFHSAWVDEHEKPVWKQAVLASEWKSANIEPFNKLFDDQLDVIWVHPEDFDLWASSVSEWLAGVSANTVDFFDSEWALVDDVEGREDPGQDLAERLEFLEQARVILPGPHTIIMKRFTGLAYTKLEIRNPAGVWRDFDGVIDYSVAERLCNQASVGSGAIPFEAAACVRFVGHRPLTNRIMGVETYILMGGETMIRLANKADLHFVAKVVAFEVLRAGELCEAIVDEPLTEPLNGWHYSDLLMTGTGEVRNQFEHLAASFGRADLNDLDVVETDAAACDGSHNLGNAWLQRQLVERVSLLFPHINAADTLRVIFGPVMTEGGGRAYLANLTKMTAVLFSGLPSTTFANSSRFVFAVARAMSNLQGCTVEEAMRGKSALKLSTGDDSAVLLRRPSRPA